MKGGRRIPGPGRTILGMLRRRDTAFDCFKDYVDTKGLRHACLIVEGVIKTVLIIKGLRASIFGIQTSY
jgi:hypothetical protein